MELQILVQYSTGVAFLFVASAIMGGYDLAFFVPLIAVSLVASLFVAKLITSIAHPHARARR